jgi:hypothetical protein
MDKENPRKKTEITTTSGLPVTNISKGEIEIGQAFLRDAKKTAEIRGVTLYQVVDEMAFPYTKLLCRSIAGAEILVKQKGGKNGRCS